MVLGLLVHVTPSNFFSRILRNEALGYKSYFFGTAILRKLFEIRFSYKHCNFARVCLLVKMASETVTRDAIHSTKIQPSPTGKRGPPQKVDLFFRTFSGLDRTDPLSFGPKFPEILVEWIAPKVYLSIKPVKTFFAYKCKLS